MQYKAVSPDILQNETILMWYKSPVCREFPGCSVGRRVQQSPWIEECSWESEKASKVRIHETALEYRELDQEIAPEICSRWVSLEFLAECYQYMSGIELVQVRERTSQEEQRKQPAYTVQARNSLYSYSQNRKPCHYCNSSGSYLKTGARLALD